MMSSLLRSEPIAIRLMIAISRWGEMPVTYCGVAATSSTAAAETFAEVLTAMAAVSSTVATVSLARVAISSRRAKKPDMPAGYIPEKATTPRSTSRLASAAVRETSAT